MKNKNHLFRICALFLALTISLLSLCGCRSEKSGDPESKVTESGGNTEVTEAGSTPLFWRVTSAGDDTGIWLFGTIHIGREEFYPLPKDINDAFDSSDALAVEYDIVESNADTEALTENMASFVYTDGSTISDYISPELYDSAVGILSESGAYSAYLDYLKPSFWALMLSSLLYETTDTDAGCGADEYLLNKAKDDGKEILEVESASEQFSMYSGFSDALSLYLLESSVEEYNSDESVQLLEELLSAWREGDEDKIYSILVTDEMPDGISEEEIALADEYEKAMFTDRNKHMTETAVEYLNSDMEVFFAVGTAHMLGEDGIVASLRSLGYNVEPVG